MAYRLIPILCLLLAMPNVAVAEPKFDDDALADMHCAAIIVRQDDRPKIMEETVTLAAPGR